MPSLRRSYEILQLSPGAEPEVVEAAYRALIRKYHPDVNNGKHEEFVKLINQAYDVIRSGAEGDSCRGDNIDLDEESPELILYGARVLYAEGLKDYCDNWTCLKSASEACASVADSARGTDYELLALELRLTIEYERLHNLEATATIAYRLMELVPPSGRRDELFAVLLDCCMRRRQFEKAVEAADRAISEATSSYAARYAHVVRADALAGGGRYTDALAAFDFIEQDYRGTPAASYAAYRIARILDSDLRRYSDAISAYQRVLSEYPTSEEAKDCDWRIQYITKRHIEKKPFWEW